MKKFLFSCISNEFIIYKEINSNHPLSKKSYILLGYYLLELEITLDEPFFSQKNSNTNTVNSKFKFNERKKV